MAHRPHGVNLRLGGGRHDLGIRGDGLPLASVNQAAVRQQHQPMRLGGLKHSRRPGYPPRVIAPQHRAHVASLSAHILEAAEHLGGDGNHIPRPSGDLPRLGVHPPAKSPAAVLHDEHLRRLVAVLGVHAMGLLAHPADVEPVRHVDMHMLVRVLGDAGADDGEVLLLVAGRPGIDERSGAGAQVPIAHQPRLHLGLAAGRVHQGSLPAAAVLPRQG